MAAAKSAQASTGIAGLDQLLDGGFPTRRMHLIEGVPGTGRTTLALQFLLTARARGERTLYITLSETTEELRAVAESHGWSLDGIETYQLAPVPNRAAEEYTLYHPAEVELADLTKTLLERADQVQPACVVVDSLSELRLLARDPLRYRRQVLGLKEFLPAAGRPSSSLMTIPLDTRICNCAASHTAWCCWSICRSSTAAPAVTCALSRCAEWPLPKAFTTS